MAHEKNTLKFDADDSSDEEDINNQIKDYNLEENYDNYLADTNIPEFIREADPEGFSFLAYAIGVKQFYSPKVNAVYYPKKQALGETIVEADESDLKKWLWETVEQTMYQFFLIPAETALTQKLTKKFLKDNKASINANITEWINSNLRIFFRECEEKEFILDDTKNCLSPIIDDLKTFIDLIDERKENFSNPPYFKYDDINSLMAIYIQKFYEDNGLMLAGRFLPQPNRKNTYKIKFEDKIENFLVEESKRYSGRNTINNVPNIFKSKIFSEILIREINLGDAGIVEKHGGQFRFKKNVARINIKNSSLGFLLDEPKIIDKYLPYSTKRLKNIYLPKLNISFMKIFVTQLADKKNLLKIKLNRAVLPQQYTFHSKNTIDFIANLRLAVRVQRRRIRQAKEDEENTKIEGEKFQTAWKFSTQTNIALETQEITVNGARTDQIKNLETYPNINWAEL